ncbi:glycosyltransferase [uncultured Tateyamaria sp.]|uniref:tetratricopeptide repeat protein n=1 Tax=uncultured Tateyamaria sp. TaxID=455651 RepID=UPI00262A1C3F|nr:glycosyltransferase [uncultured Tateyamaria sp.]
MTSPTSPSTLMAQLRQQHEAGDDIAAAEMLERILTLHPALMPAHRWRIEQLLNTGETDRAVDLARDVSRQFPQLRTMATTKEATALVRLGRVEDALALLDRLHEDGQQDRPASILFANLLLRTGALERAASLFEGIRADIPDHTIAVRGLIDIAIKQGRGADGLDLCDEAAELNCLAHASIETRRAQCLDLMGESEAAISVLSDLVGREDATAQNHLTLARLHRKVGDLVAASKVFGAILANTPDHAAAVQEQVALLQQMGAYEDALSVCDRAIAHSDPVPEVFHIRRAQTLLAAGRAADAAHGLNTVCAEGDPSGALLLELAKAHVQAGALQDADAAFVGSAAHPATRLRAILGRAKIAQQRDDPEGAIALLQSEMAAQEVSDPTLTLALCEALIRAGRAPEIKDLLQQLADQPHVLSDGQMEHVLTLAERQTLPDISSTLIDAMMDRERLSLVFARRLLRLAHITADTKMLREVADALCAKLPPVHQAEFRVDVASFADGPEAALALARKVSADSQSPRLAMLVGRHLADTGSTQLAMRYLRRAARRWPEHRALNGFFVHVCGMARDFAAGHAHLDAMVAANPRIDVERERLLLMHSERCSQPLLDRAIRRQDAGLPGLHPRHFLDVCLACGDLDRALATRQHIRTDPQSTNRVAAHFATGLHGRMLADLQVFRTLEAKAKGQGTPQEEIEGRLAAQYYYPAKCIVDRWDAAADPSVPPRQTPIPKRIFQYWDTEAVPDDVAALIADWAAVPDFEHVLLNRQRAVNFLRRQFGARAVTAFNRARHVAEESDLIRLCVLYKFGGIYSDADDRAVGDIGALASLGAGLVVTREPIGAIANNTMITPPGNPIVQIALNMTIRALLARDADAAWFKTGPGMLTCAAAQYLRDAPPEEARETLTILRGDTLRTFIEPHIPLPYKKTVRYWNAQVKDVSQKVLAGLSRLANDNV